MSKMQRTKGAAWERVVTNAFNVIFGEGVCRRNLQAQGGSVVGSDVVTPLFHVECKHGIKPNPRAALEQCENDNPKRAGKYCIAVVKDNQKPAFVVMRFSEFLHLVQEGQP